MSDKAWEAFARQEGPQPDLTLMTPANCEKADDEDGPFCPAWQAYFLRAEVERLLLAMGELLLATEPTKLRLQARLEEAERLLDDAKHAPGPFALMTVEEWWTAYHAWYDAARAADSASGVQYKPCEICTTQSWCETHGCQCYPVSAVQPERCCLDYPRCDCNSPPEPDNAPTLQPCGHPWKAQHDFKCILCSSPG